MDEREHPGPPHQALRIVKAGGGPATCPHPAPGDRHTRSSDICIRRASCSVGAVRTGKAHAPSRLRWRKPPETEVPAWTNRSRARRSPRVMRFDSADRANLAEGAAGLRLTAFWHMRGTDRDAGAGRDSPLDPAKRSKDKGHAASAWPRLLMVPGARFELARVSPYAPQTYVSTNSTTRALPAPRSSRGP